MRDELSDMDWDDLADLIIAAPPERLHLAMSRVDPLKASVTASLPGPDRLLHLATVSSGPAFDLALLRELRRLSVH